MRNYIERPTQENRILDILKAANGGWVDGMYFLNLDFPITQYHARIWALQKKGYIIEGRFVTNKNWKEYRLIENNSIPKERTEQPDTPDTREKGQGLFAVRPTTISGFAHIPKRNIQENGI